jgi:hypothetical protein
LAAPFRCAGHQAVGGGSVGDGVGTAVTTVVGILGTAVGVADEQPVNTSKTRLNHKENLPNITTYSFENVGRFTKSPYKFSFIVVGCYP